MKLTNEEIARVFAMYLGCDIEFVYNSPYVTWIRENRRANLIGVRGIAAVLNPIRRNGKLDKNSENHLKVHLCKLLLTPLKNISDEDAIEVAKLKKKNIYNEGDEDAPKGRQGLLDYGYGIVITKSFCHEGFQYLMQKGYAVPLFFKVNHWANGKTAIELGIAISTPLSV